MLAVWLSLAPMSFASASLDDQDIYWIRRPNLDCLIAHEQSYLASPDSLLVVFPTLCPTTHPTRVERQGIMENQYIPDCAAGFQSCMIPLNRQLRRCFFERLRAQARNNPRATRVTVSTYGCRS